MGHLGLEGMTSEDIRRMTEEFKAEDDRYAAALKKSWRWLARDTPSKAWRWKLARMLLGVDYEEAFFSGWFFGRGDGSYQEQNRLRECCQGNRQPNCFFGREKQESKAANEEYA